MGRFLAFLFENPIILFALAAWVFGAIGKASTKATSRRPQRPSAPADQQGAGGRAVPWAEPQPQRPDADRRAEEIAAEMRRLLGMEEPAATAATPPRVARREVVEPERPPVPVQIVTRDRRLPRQQQSHVGESIQHRHMPATTAGRGSAGLGGLGGRSEATVAGGARRQSLVGLGDLKRALVMAEVLGRPLALRRNGTGGLGSGVE
jgi:hypothetical protein